MGHLRQRSWWGVFFILVLTFWGNALASVPAPTKPWRCSFIVNMVGNTYEFYRTGFDTWDSLGEVNCVHTNTREVATHEWYIVFRSWSRSTGADSRNSFVMESKPFYLSSPTAIVGTFFYQTGAINKSVQEPSYELNLINQSAQLQVFIKRPSLPMELGMSLVSGSLIIAPIPPEINSFR